MPIRCPAALFRRHGSAWISIGVGRASPNTGHAFVVGCKLPSPKLTIDAGKVHRADLQFADLFSFSDVRWLYEELIFVHPCWSRIAATDVNSDGEWEKVTYAESVIDETIACQ
jgi:hypothetical protein